MSLPRSVPEILRQRVTLETECIDRMYCNVYIPRLQSVKGVAGFFRFHRGHPFASSALMEPISTAFVRSIERFAARESIPLITFEKGQRKEDIAAAYRAKLDREEGVILIGKAQEKARVVRTEKRRNAETGKAYPWLVPSTAMVNHYYFYCVDREFGPFFIKFCSYFPYNAKLCLNGHERVKRLLAQRGIAFEALDNGILSCADPIQLQTLCDGLSSEAIDRLLRKWLRRLPHPFTGEDRLAGYRYDISILQAEFSLTLVLDRPVTGRIFFEEVIRENLDLGRPDHVQLVFGRRITKRTRGRFRTRVITEGVVPSLHIEYKHTRIKIYFKEGRALRIEITINDTRDFNIRKRLIHLPELREIGFAANRRLLDVLSISHDCAVGEDTLAQVVRPVTVDGQRVSALRFDDPRAQALLAATLLFLFQPDGFASKDLREPLAQLLGIDPARLTQGRMSYDLRRLRLHGLIQRIPNTHRYRPTPIGLRVATFFTRTYARLLRPTLATTSPPLPPTTALARTYNSLEQQIDRLASEAHLAA